MDSWSVSSVVEQGIVNNKLPRKPARQPNPIIYRKLRRRSAAARIPGKQIELGKRLSYNKAYVKDGGDEEEWITESDEEPNSMLHNDKGKQGPQMSLQKYSKKNSSSHVLNKTRKNKSSPFDKANKEFRVYHPSSHAVNIKDMNDTLDDGQGLTKELRGSTSICETFIQFCSTEIICPHEHRAALAVKLYGVQAALLSALGNPFDNMFQSMSSRNNSHRLLISLGQASTGFLPAMIWTGMFIVSFIYTVMVVWSLAFRVPIISMLCLALLYCLSVLVATASGFNVICGTFRMNGILFASLGVLGFVLLFLILVMLVLLASSRRTNHDGGTM